MSTACPRPSPRRGTERVPTDTPCRWAQWCSRDRPHRTPAARWVDVQTVASPGRPPPPPAPVPAGTSLSKLPLPPQCTPPSCTAFSKAHIPQQSQQYPPVSSCLLLSVHAACCPQNATFCPLSASYTPVLSTRPSAYTSLMEPAPRQYCLPILLYFLAHPRGLSWPSTCHLVIHAAAAVRRSDSGKQCHAAAAVR